MKRYALGWGVVFLLVASLVAAAPLILEDKPLIFEYNEGEIVRLVPEGSDRDDDIVTFEYDEPLNASGEWQTTFDDAGTYVTTVRASDGASVTEKEVTLIINDVNQAPEIRVDDLTVDESDFVEVVPEASDADGDDVQFVFSSPLDKDGTWQTEFGDAGAYQTTVTATDGKAIAEAAFTITVLKKNQPPLITSATPHDERLSVQENEEITFDVSARDAEDHPVTIIWRVDDTQAAEGPLFAYHAGYDDAGEHVIVAELSDGEATTEREWLVTVDNVNRAPLVDVANVHVNENETIDLKLPATDEDGDELAYNFSGYFSDKGIWQTTFNDAGVYDVVITATDGELTTEKKITVTVDGVDRAPEVLAIDNVELDETEALTLDIHTSDPDGDDVTLGFEGVEEATLEDAVFSWTPSYDAVLKPNSFFVSILKFFRLDSFFYPPERTFPVIVTACGSEKCSTIDFSIVVKNKNRAPIIEELTEIEVREGEAVSLKPVASDPDNDHVTVTVGEPVGKRWITDFSSAGVYDVAVTATDGEATSEETVHVVVRDVNRPPTIEAVQDVAVPEGNELSFSVNAQDPDSDDVVLVAEDMPDGAAFNDGVFSWTPDYDTLVKEDKQASFQVTFRATDHSVVKSNRTNSTNTSLRLDDTTDELDADVTETVTITVINQNRAPQLSTTIPERVVKVMVTVSVNFKAVAEDLDGDDLTYTWDFGFLDSVETSKGVRRRFSEVGDKNIRVVVSDGDKEVEHSWVIRVLQRKKATPVDLAAAPTAQPITQPITQSAAQPVAVSAAVVDTSADSSPEQSSAQE